MAEIHDIIRKKYTMDRELAVWRWEVQQLETEVPRRVYELREAKAAQAEYEGGFRCFLDKVSGKYEEKKEECSRIVREAQAAKETCQRELELAKNALAALEEEAKALPTREELFEKYPEMEYLKQQDALFCADRLVRLLKENEKYLLEARDWAENRHADFKPLGTQYEKSRALLDAGTRAREICSLLERIQQCGFLLEIHAYFRSPDGYIAGAARQFGQQDRINYAIRAIRTTQSLIQELILQLAEE